MQYSKALNMNYQYFPSIDIIRFDDGVCYSMEEAIILSRATSEEIIAVHKVKKEFAGVLLRD